MSATTPIDQTHHIPETGKFETETPAEDWCREVLARYPNAQFTLETGEGETYGEPGDITAHVGPDMQANVVGVLGMGAVQGVIFLWRPN